MKWPKAMPAELRTGWRLLLTLYWWLWSLFLPRVVKKDLAGLKKLLDTPLKVQAWLWANVKYTPDKTLEDDWQKAERTFERRKGDCEDWAILAAHLLTRRYKMYYLCMYTLGSGHATLLVEIAPGACSPWKWSTQGLGYFVPLGLSGVSVGTYGLNRHEGKLPDIVSDWSGFQDWTTAVLMDEGMMVLEVWYRQLPDET